MRQRQLGRSGLWVSEIGLGTMTWGRDTDADEAAAQLTAFRDAGGTLVDTADVYTDGEAESILGTLLAKQNRRDNLVIATKAGITPHADRRRNASRGHLLSALDASLARLGTDYVDLWQIHAFDLDTPLAETLNAVDIAVASGRVRYLGLSNFAGWQLAAAAVTGRHRDVHVVSTQAEYSLLERAAETDVLPAAQYCGVDLLAWSPLGRGVLTGKYRRGTPADSRGASVHLRPFVSKYLTPGASRIVDAVVTAADGLDATPTAVALSWVCAQNGIAAAVVGARSVGQLMTSLAATELTLPDEIHQALSDVSKPA